jgi:hypothetical protein
MHELGISDKNDRLTIKKIELMKKAALPVNKSSITVLEF